MSTNVQLIEFVIPKKQINYKIIDSVLFDRDTIHAYYDPCV